MRLVRVTLIAAFVLSVVSMAHAGAMILTDPTCDSTTKVSDSNLNISFTANSNGFGTFCFYNNGGADDPNGVPIPYSGILEPSERWTGIDIFVPDGDILASNVVCDADHVFQSCTKQQDTNGYLTEIDFSGVSPVATGLFGIQYINGPYTGVLEGFTLYIDLASSRDPNCPRGSSLCTPWLDPSGDPISFTGKIISSTVPEPASLALFGSGLGLAGLFLRKRSFKS
jgi:hypothetical protein